MPWRMITAASPLNPRTEAKMTYPATHQKTPARAAIASWIGTTLEYYDFAVYGTAAALVLNILFFPPELPAGVKVLLSMSTFAIGFVVRPLGALILGPLGDRFGRKFVMMITLFGIGGCTFADRLPSHLRSGRRPRADPADRHPHHPGALGLRRTGECHHAEPGTRR